MSQNGNAPIKITLYDPETNEVKSEHSRVFVPWGVLKRAVRLMKGLDPQDMNEDDVDAMAGIVCEAFGNKFSVEELGQGADVGEMMTVIQQIIGRANLGQPGGRQVAKGERPLPEKPPRILQEE